MTDLTIVIPYFNGEDYIEPLLDGIPTTIPVIVVDDQSEVPYQSNRANVTVIRPPTKGYFTGAVNVGIKACITDVLVLNQDVLLGIGWQDVIEKNKAECALIGERIGGPHPAWPNGYIHGTFMFMRRDALASVGLLNATLYPLWGSTCEWQVRLVRKGFKAMLLKKVPGFTHLRKGDIGSTMKKTLRLSNRTEQELFFHIPPEISVIVPCYNQGRYLPDLVASMIGGESSIGPQPGQSMQSFEIIIVNDKSTDDSAQWCNKLHDPTKGIHVIHMPKNVGKPAAMNAAIRVSHGKYLTCLDADDMRAPDALKELYLAQVANKHSMIFDGVMAFKDGEVRPELSFNTNKYNFDDLLLHNMVHTGMMFPRTAWEAVDGWPEIMTHGREDWAMAVRLGVNGYCGIRIPYRGYLYRRERQNRTLTNTSPKDHQAFLEQIMSLYPRIYAGERPPMCCGNKPKGALVTMTNKRSLSGANVVVPSDQTIIEYIGASLAMQSFYGPVTGARYSAGKSHKIIQVATQDLATGLHRKPGLLEMMENGKYVFQKPRPAVAKPKQEVILNKDTKAVEIKVAAPAPVALLTVPEQQIVPALDVEKPIEPTVTYGGSSEMWTDPSAPVTAGPTVDTRSRRTRKKKSDETL